MGWRPTSSTPEFQSITGQKVLTDHGMVDQSNTVDVVAKAAISTDGTTPASYRAVRAVRSATHAVPEQMRWMAATIPVVFLVELGVAVALGVVLDTMIVRSVLVTAVNLDLGDRIWWPRRGPVGAPSRGRFSPVP